jgi:hypothetical protein
MQATVSRSTLAYGALISDFVHYTAIQFLHNGLHEFDSANAVKSIQELIEGKRKLKLAPEKPFH